MILPTIASSPLPRSADCVVIGGGVLGAATAFYAGRAGLRTVLLEKRAALCTLTTPASAAAFRLQFDNREELDLVRESLEVFDHFAAHTELPGYDLGLHRQGYLWLTTTAEGAANQKRLVERQRRWGLDDVELLSSDEARLRFPYLAPEIVSARFRAGDGWLDARRLTMGFAAASGATFVLETAATGFEIAGGRLKGVQTSRGIVACNLAVIAAGPFSGKVADWAGLDLRLETKIRHRLIFPELPDVPPGAPMTIDEDTGSHWRPHAGGAFVLYPQQDTPVGPPLESVPADVEFYFTLMRPESPASVARTAPFWREVWRRNTDAWYLTAGQYTYTPDHRPYLGPTPVAGLGVNCGYSGHGVMASAGGSRLTIDALLGRVKPEENPFGINRPMQPEAAAVL
jgi:glycine/D-amino acid oxidase-like deaminating enzyme